jgi:hypothetical protein
MALAGRVQSAFGQVRVSPMNWADAASCAAMLLSSIVMLATLSDYGLTYDEEPHIRYGERVLTFYTHGLELSGSLRRSSYGAGFDLFAALLRRVSPWDEFRTNHFACVFVAQLGLLGTWKLGRLIGGATAGLWSLVFLLLTPVYYGHQFNNPKDIPFAAGYVWGLYFIAQLFSRPAASDPPGGPHAGRPGWRYWCGLALALGLAMSVRVAGAVLIGYSILFSVLYTLDQWRLGTPAAWRDQRRLALLWVASVFGAWLVMLLSWPRAIQSPLGGPAAALETASNFVAYDSPTLLRGRSISANAVPWDYLPTYFAVQLPEFTSVCLLASVVALCGHTVRALRERRPVLWAGWLLVVAVALPPLYAIVRHSTLYNGLRHFLFLIPPISVLAGTGVAALLGQLLRQRSAFRWVAGAALGVFVADQLHATWRLHPHQHVFFNRASGGLRPAVERYETEYYGSVYRELGDKLVEQLWRERRDSYLNTTLEVTGCGSKLFFTKNLPLNFQYKSLGQARSADLYASYARDKCLTRYRAHPVLTEVKRDGATLAVARDLKRTRSPRAKPRGAAPQ